MTKSMTGFASATGSADGFSWSWDLRSVNARGMDARLRVPDWIEGLEAAIRPAIQKTVARGNVNLTLRVSRDEVGQGNSVDPDVLATVLASIQQIEDTATNEHRLNLAPTSAADILSMRVISDATRMDRDTKPLLAELKKDFTSLLTAFDAMRKNEGKALSKVLNAQLVQISKLTKDAAKSAKNRRDATVKTLRENLARVLDNTDRADPDRVAQELAIISLKADITEEIDRLHAHVSAAKELLATKGPVGRKLDFLSQEFNREANTLCSKAQSKELTAIGLDLKAVIDQMREQVQNVE
ncbi:MAG: YicC/YloC family endoribonuclease [Paracoccaceae bacterium]